ncbi:MAG: glycoside hydrolase family 2 protein, partial [Planctomycetota bacterium]
MDSKHTEKWSFQNIKWFSLSLCTVLLLCSSIHAKWKPANGPLMTRWAGRISPKNAHREYPRPQMVRKSWQNLNGLWDYAIVHKSQPQPDVFDGRILVPYPIESALSGVMKPVGRENRLWYRRTFRIPRTWKGSSVLLHFGAVDFDTTVWVNGTQVGTHQGGYDPFTFDITDALNDTGQQQVVLSVWDPTNAGTQPRGKQVSKPRGIWYTAVTGIWQTAWLEPVPGAYIKSIRIIPDIDNKSVRITAACSNPAGHSVEIEARDGWFTKAKNKGNPGEEIVLKFKKPKLWSPDSPFLYDLEVSLKDGKGKKADAVSSYFGMRKIEIGKDEKGINRLLLNNKTLFQYGPLDQGWWPDGLYTAPSDAALRYDIEVLKKLGCNMLRKHVKIEPARLYYWCDKLGLMVWQDMPSGDKYIGGNDPDIERSPESARQFEAELKAMITTFYNHPSIIMWVPYNEGWGQWDTARITDLIKELDPTRLVNSASGWTDRGVGDVHDIHSYPGPAVPPVEENRAGVLGEFGGLGLPVKGHTWQDEKNWGYRSYKTPEELTDAYVALIDNLRSLISDGLAAAVYTQTTDVEIEVNGMMTYDRAMIKMDAKKAAKANNRLYLPPPILKTIVPTSQRQPQSWRYTTNQPPEGWQQADFDDSNWQKGQGGFGTEETPGTIVRTEWTTPDIWVRRTFELEDAGFSRPQLSIHHDEDAEVYINGLLVAKLQGY